MAGHRFRFQPLLDLRIAERDAARGALAEANEAVARLIAQRQQLSEQRLQVLQDTSISRSGPLRVDNLLAQGRYERQLALDETQLAAAQTQIEAEVQRRQAALRASEIEVRRLELIQAKDRQARLTQQLRGEQATMDEIAARTVEGNPWSAEEKPWD